MHHRRICGLLALAFAINGVACSSDDKKDGNGGSGGGGSGGSSAGSGGSSGGSGGSSAGSGGSSGGSSGGASAGSTAGSSGAGSGGSGGAAAGAAGSAAGAGGAAAGASGATLRVASALTCPAGATGDPLPAIAMRKATLIKGGFKHGEGPVWIASMSALLFSDLQDMDGAPTTYWRQPSSSKIMIHKPADGMVVTEWLATAGTNGLALSADLTKLVASSIHNRTVSTIDLATKAVAEVASKYMNLPFNVTNDVTVRSDGNIYVSDPLWQADLLGMDAGMPPAKSMKVYRIAPGGAVTLVDDSMIHPNGVALSPDGRVLYVTAISDQSSLAPTWSGAGKIRKYVVKEDGSTEAGSDFASGVKFPDGLVTDCAGNVYVATQEGVVVFKPDGMKLGTIAIPTASNPMPDAADMTKLGGANSVAFGGADHKTLFVVGTTLSSITLNVPGPN